MARSSEHVKVGIVVVLAALLFLVALVFVGGVNIFRKKMTVYTTYFKFAGGLEPGSYVRFGGMKVGTVKSAAIDAEDSTRIKVVLTVSEGTPIRMDSRARISTLGFLGENYVEVSPGSREATLLPAGSEIPASEIVQLADVFNNVNNITVNANKLVNDLDERILVLSDNANELIKNMNALLGPGNREHLSSVLSNADAMLAESRPHFARTMQNLDAASQKLAPAIDSANVTLNRASALAAHLDSVVQDSGPEIRETLKKMQVSLADTQRLVNHLDDTIQNNRGNLDEALENVRSASENLKQFSETLKQRPYSLVRIKNPKDRQPPTGK
jgi:phospholipid/cholesterol/gamma-HCH transport system substrate-binding protein